MIARFQRHVTNAASARLSQIFKLRVLHAPTMYYNIWWNRMFHIAATLLAAIRSPPPLTTGRKEREGP